MQTEIRKKIKFGETEILVTNVYPFMYSNGKVVLRVSALESNTDEATLKLLKDNKGVVEQWEQTITVDDEGNTTEGEWVLKMTHENYNSGDYTSSYANGEYSCEVTRVGVTEQKVKSLEDELANTNEALEQTNANLEFVALMADVEI